MDIETQINNINRRLDSLGGNTGLDIKNDSDFTNHDHNGNNSPRVNLFDVFGTLESSNIIPTIKTQTFYDQFKIYSDSTSNRLYWYNTLNNLWESSTADIESSINLPSTSGSMTANMFTRINKITPTGDCTFNASGGIPGYILTFYITTSGVTSYTLTFGTNFKSTGTLATGTSTGKIFTISFICLDGTTWSEISRTTAM